MAFGTLGRQLSWVPLLVMPLCNGAFAERRISDSSSFDVPGRDEVIRTEFPEGTPIPTRINLPDSADQRIGPEDYTDAGDFRLEAKDLEFIKWHKLNIRSKTSDTFDFLSRVTVYLEAPGLDPIVVAELPEIPRGQTELSLNVDNRDVKKWFLTRETTIFIDVAGWVPDNPMKLEADYSLDVGVTASGGCKAITSVTGPL